jgi:hypothetical protein
MHALYFIRAFFIILFFFIHLYPEKGCACVWYGGWVSGRLGSGVNIDDRGGAVVVWMREWVVCLF